MQENLLIIGAGGHGKVVGETAWSSGHYSKISYLDIRYSTEGVINILEGMPLIGSGSIDELMSLRHSYNNAIVAVGNPEVRKSLLGDLQICNYNIPTVIHPTAWVSPSASIGFGSVVFAMTVVQANTRIGIGCILNTSCSIDHDSLMGDYVHACPGARIAGSVTIGTMTWLGINSTIIQQICIGKRVIVGAGSVLINDLPDNVTAVGVPARILQR